VIGEHSRRGLALVSDLAATCNCDVFHCLAYERSSPDLLGLKQALEGFSRSRKLDSSHALFVVATRFSVFNG
jgi:hypothetical protein